MRFRKGLVILRQLLSRGVDPNVRDRDGRQPIHWAASASSVDAILALVHHGDADIHSQDGNGLAALHCAASAGHEDCIDQLITLCGARVDEPDLNGCTALFYAASQGHGASVRTLIMLGARPDITDRKGRTAAHGAAARGHLAILNVMQQHGADLWMANAKGSLPLHEAIRTGKVDIVSWLLTQRPGAVHIENGEGRQPLHMAAAAKSQNLELVRQLVARFGADINAICRGGRDQRQLYTPLDLAQRAGHKAAARFLRQAGGMVAKKLVSQAALQHSMAQALAASSDRQGQHQSRRDSRQQQLAEASLGGLLYSPEASPRSAFSWRSCYTVNTEQAARSIADLPQAAAPPDQPVSIAGSGNYSNRLSCHTGKLSFGDFDLDEAFYAEENEVDDFVFTVENPRLRVIQRTQSAPNLSTGMGGHCKQLLRLC